LLPQDSLFLGLGAGGKEAVASELECRESVGFTDQQTYDTNQLTGILGAQGYTAGIRYGGTYGVNPLACLQGIKDLLVENGMQVFESTEMERLEDHTAYARGQRDGGPHHRRGGQAATISVIASEAFHAQTFLSVTGRSGGTPPVSFGRADAVLGFRPVYTYFRLTGDNRLLLGGGSPATTYPASHNNPGVIGE
jgi:gamma-glutamylputrescine oxidase